MKTWQKYLATFGIGFGAGSIITGVAAFYLLPPYLEKSVASGVSSGMSEGAEGVQKSGLFSSLFNVSAYSDENGAVYYDLAEGEQLLTGYTSEMEARGGWSKTNCVEHGNDSYCVGDVVYPPRGGKYVILQIYINNSSNKTPDGKMLVKRATGSARQLFNMNFNYGAYGIEFKTPYKTNK